MEEACTSTIGLDILKPDMEFVYVNNMVCNLMEDIPLFVPPPTDSKGNVRDIKLSDNVSLYRPLKMYRSYNYNTVAHGRCSMSPDSKFRCSTSGGSCTDIMSVICLHLPLILHVAPINKFRFI